MLRVRNPQRASRSTLWGTHFLRRRELVRCDFERFGVEPNLPKAAMKISSFKRPGIFLSTCLLHALVCYQFYSIVSEHHTASLALRPGVAGPLLWAWLAGFSVAGIATNKGTSTTYEGVIDHRRPEC